MPCVYVVVRRQSLLSGRVVVFCASRRGLRVFEPDRGPPPQQRNYVSLPCKPVQTLLRFSTQRVDLVALTGKMSHVFLVFAQNGKPNRFVSVMNAAKTPVEFTGEYVSAGKPTAHVSLKAVVSGEPSLLLVCAQSADCNQAIEFCWRQHISDDAQAMFDRLSS